MKRQPGAHYLENDITLFTVWAPFKKSVQVIFKDEEKIINLQQTTQGYWEKRVKGISLGTLYKFRLDDTQDFPDPASKSQPEGVHSWSKVMDPDFQWDEKSWTGIPLAQMLIYEIHVGTFTEEGTFQAVVEKLDHLIDLGINTIELMPISQFPGNRNWGYDGVYPYAAQESYGGAAGLKTLVQACHQKGIAVILDVVYNHMGPEGNYLAAYGPYFTEKYQTPWGSALNFDDKYSDEVRNFFLQNALMWLDEFRIDGLRLDAIHEIIDRGATHLLKELSIEVDKLEKSTGRTYVLIAESDLNDIKIINPYEKGGFGLEGQWVDDFHHAIHALVTGEKDGYYTDYGRVEDMAKAYEQGFIYDGVYSKFRKRTVGNSPVGLAPGKFVVSIQNHDQIGNRMLGERLSEIISFEGLKLAAGVLISSKFVPMLFMGEEFAADTPFMYFVSHGDPDLVAAVQKGRKREFEYYYSKDGDFPDPQAEDTFNNSKLQWNFKEDTHKNQLFQYYKYLFHLRKTGEFVALSSGNFESESDEDSGVLKIIAGLNKELFAVFNFGARGQSFSLPQSSGKWSPLLASADKKWGGNFTIPKVLTRGTLIEIPPQSLLICKAIM